MPIWLNDCEQVYEKMKMGEDSRVLEPQSNSGPEILIESRIARPKITVLY